MSEYEITMFEILNNNIYLTLQHSIHSCLYHTILLSYFISLLATVLWFPSNIEKVSGRNTLSSDLNISPLKTAGGDYLGFMDLNCDRCELLGYRWLNRNIGPSYHGLCVGLTHHWNKELPHLNNRVGGGGCKQTDEKDWYSWCFRSFF